MHHMYLVDNPGMGYPETISQLLVLEDNELLV